MADSITSVFTEASDEVSSIFNSPYKLLFIALVILLFLVINNIIIYLIYVKIRNSINEYCERKIKNIQSSKSKK